MIAPVIVVLRLVQHRTVTMATMYGAIAAYLMIAVAYFFLFLTVGQWQGHRVGLDQRDPDAGACGGEKPGRDVSNDQPNP